MSKITLEDIRKELEPEGWQVLSQSYKNLDTEMEFLCDEGHRVFGPWKKLRTKRYCPICANNIYKNIEVGALPKKKDVTRVIALDQATKITGYAVFDNQQLVKYGVFEVTLENEIARDNVMKMWLINMIENWEPDIIGIEGIQFQTTINGQHSMGITTFETLARLQGILMEACFEKKVKYEICPTNTWRAHCKVKGRTRADKKASTKALIKEWYDIKVTEDEADAIGIGKYLAESVAPATVVQSWEK